MRTHLIIAAALVVGLAVPAAVAHTEGNPNACTNQEEPCRPAENHHKCKGNRYAIGGENDGTQLGLTLVDEPEDVGAYLDTRGDGDEEALVPTPGILFIETNGFDKLQRSDWKCASKEHEAPPAEWIEHPDQVVI